MGFGSYDESEQENQDLDADFDDDDGVRAAEEVHEGSVDYEPGASNDELLDRLQEIKSEET
ncbi:MULTISPECIES: DUF5786 family protein [Halorubrum]|jgi:hypothetical protein|uniref:Death domain-associated protein n=6 Tax=Halorubrum TaxID=56688 RepID=A0A2G1WHQ0_9EURY|nr:MULTISPECIES: DUF5786 family protein [Halorubrum]OYR64259.1 death domain-associated protein [Halorubrum sp. E3]ELZ37721.1 hypothetical protein C471_11486 [Halorubrum saccharovorum DSM 1137]EMA61424.1 hypothetical protein C469_06991 [Halorubrum lipolyticum DSM 21995]EMA62323.1 hypothetical protein C468_10977 [Halorubrum kocurii JCM 14978]PAU85284.1 death domain-associated protein [Halorubrum salipaludis]